MSVSIVGVGLHPFGRFDISGREMGLIAARAALADAGVAWSDVGFAAGGSRDSGHAAALVSELGLTGVPFIGVYNGCGTAGSAVLACQQAIESGATDVALAVGFDKHARGAFGSNPADYGLPDWYAENGMIVSRELGIPCVVSVADGTDIIPDGAIVTVDGNAGTVTIVG